MGIGLGGASGACGACGALFVWRTWAAINPCSGSAVTDVVPHGPLFHSFFFLSLYFVPLYVHIYIFFWSLDGGLTRLLSDFRALALGW